MCKEQSGGSHAGVLIRDVFTKVEYDLNLEAGQELFMWRGRSRKNQMKPFGGDTNLPKMRDGERGGFLICIRSAKALVTIGIRGGSALRFGQGDPLQFPLGLRQKN